MTDARRQTPDSEQPDEALHEQREWLRVTLSSIGDAVITTDTEGRVTFLNPVAQSLTGWTLDEAVGVSLNNVFKIVNEETRQTVENPATKVLREGVVVGLANHTLLIAKDQDVAGRPIDDSAAPIRNVKGEVAGVVLVFRDITERRRAEAIVRDSELRYRRLFETARDGILILDANTGKITDANPFMTEMLGYPRSELFGKELWQIGLFRDRESSQLAVRQLQERGHIRYDHLPLETKSGQPVDVEFVSNVYDVDHQPVIQCNIRDITDRTQLERTKVQAEAMADLHRRKDEFLAMLSHELRNPLAPIVNAVQLLGLQKKNENPVQQQARTIIERQVGQLKVLVDDLLEVSRITTGRIRLHKENMDVRAVVERAVESVQSLIDQQQHELTVSQPPEPIWLHADATRIEQVVVNLLTNAAKYTDASGHIWLTVQQEGEEAVLCVRDTGVGIAPDLLPRIFDLFTQSERSLDRSQGGLGIGLTVVQKLVEMHGGRVEAYSALGRGSEFVVHLPVLPHPQPQPLPAEPAKQPSPSLRVLVVDDNVDQADSVALLLRLSGHEVRVAYSGSTALEAAVAYQPNLMLLDLGLPEMDGYEVARRLRQNPQFKDVRLVALSGYGQDADRHRSRAAGFDVHLVKPVNPRELQEVLASVSER